MTSQIRTSLLLPLLLIAQYAFSQTSGKIAGYVTDSRSGVAVVNAGITIENTSFRAATGRDGYFVILNVPVGVYTVRAEMIGYGPLSYRNVRVNAGVTTEVNFSLEEHAVSEPYLFVNDFYPGVYKNGITSEALITAEEIEHLPIRDFQRLIALQTSVVEQDGNIHIRGGRAGEAGYFVDGALSTNLLTNTQSIHIIPEAVEAIQVQKGGISAEYGNALSGLVMTHLKTGGDRLKYTLDYRTDNFAGEGQQFLGTYAYQHQTGIFTFGGPIYNENIRFFLAGEYSHKGDRQVRFSKGFDLVALNGGPLIDQQHLTTNRDTIDSYTYPDGFTPGHSEELWAMQGTLLFNFQPIQLRLSTSWSDRSQQFNSGIAPRTPMLDVLNERYFDETQQNFLQSVTLSWKIRPRTVGELSYRHHHYERDTEDSYFGNDWMKWYDSLEVAKATHGTVQYNSRYRRNWPYKFNGWDFAQNGDPHDNYLRQTQDYQDFGLRFTSQIGRNHELKFGGNYRKHTLRQFEIHPAVMASLEEYNTADIKAVDPNRWISWGAVNNYGYDIYGRPSDEDIYEGGIQFSEAPKRPVFASLFVQDNIEYNNLTVTAGLRYDYLDPKGKQFADPTSPEFDLNTSRFTAKSFQKLDPFHYLSPRLSLSVLLSGSSVLFANYGKFVQLAPLETIYAGNNKFSREIINTSSYIQNPVALGLKPVHSNVIEVGLRQRMNQHIALQATGFYRKTEDQITMVKEYPSNISPYNSLTNGDGAEATGLDLSLNIQHANRLQGVLNYTFSRVQGSGSVRNFHANAIERNNPPPRSFHPLEYQQKHRGSVILDYRLGANEGGAIFRNFGVNAAFSFHSGHPYTLSAVSPIGSATIYEWGVGYIKDARALRFLEPPGSSQTPLFHNFDLRIDKKFDLIHGIFATAYVQINNLFNTKNVINVYPGSGVANNDGFYTDRSNPFRDAYISEYGEAWLAQHKAINIDNGQAYWDVTGKELYGHPRQIFLGIKLSH